MSGSAPGARLFLAAEPEDSAKRRYSRLAIVAPRSGARPAHRGPATSAVKPVATPGSAIVARAGPAGAAGSDVASRGSRTLRLIGTRTRPRADDITGAGVGAGHAVFARAVPQAVDRAPAAAAQDLVGARVDPAAGHRARRRRAAVHAARARPFIAASNLARKISRTRDQVRAGTAGADDDAGALGAGTAGRAAYRLTLVSARIWPRLCVEGERVEGRSIRDFAGAVGRCATVPDRSASILTARPATGTRRIEATSRGHRHGVGDETHTAHLPRVPRAEPPVHTESVPSLGPCQVAPALRRVIVCQRPRARPRRPAPVPTSVERSLLFAGRSAQGDEECTVGRRRSDAVVAGQATAPLPSLRNALHLGYLVARHGPCCRSGPEQELGGRQR